MLRAHAKSAGAAEERITGHDERITNTNNVAKRLPKVPLVISLAAAAAAAAAAGAMVPEFAMPACYCSGYQCC